MSLSEPTPISSGALRVPASDLRGFRTTSLAGGEVIYRQGEPLSELFVVAQGRVRLQRRVASGREILTTLLGRGDVFGRLILGGVSTIAFETALADPADIVRLSPNDMKNAAGSPSDRGVQIIEWLAQGLGRERARLHRHTAADVPSLLARTLLWLGEEHGRPCEEGGEMDVTGVTQRDIADVMGSHRTFVSTKINELKRVGVLNNHGRVLCLRNTLGLREMAGVIGG